MADRMDIAVVVGTRPELIKMAELIALLGSRAELIHTGQHYDHSLSGQFFDQLGLTAPTLNLGIGSRLRGQQIASGIDQLSVLFDQRRPRAVVVHGDTNAALSGAVAANAAGVPLVHVEAGLRSHDRAMPEEHNRVVVDHLSDLCLAPTDTNVANLTAERIDGERVVVTGNTVVGAVQRLLPEPGQRQRLRQRLGLADARFALSTIHRPENTDDTDVLATILGELASLEVPVVLPMHPRTRDRAERAGLAGLLRNLVVLEPIGYREFLGLAADASLLVSDSGGIQEEASVLKRPVITVRRSTERPEILGTFGHLVPPGPMIRQTAAAILAEGDTLLQRLAEIPSPYGNGDAAERCMHAIDHLLNGGDPRE